MRQQRPTARPATLLAALALLVSATLPAIPALPAAAQEAEPPATDDPRPAAAGEDTEDDGDGEQTEATAEDGEAPDRLRIYDRVEVRGRADDQVGIAASASEGSTGRAELARRPVLRAGEIVETVPGVIATQHSGGGKANQYFLRGFNLDHGSDFRISVGDVQVNMPSHGHGQGYADLSFLIPELIDRVSYRKGPYDAESGDFSAAGAVDIHLVRTLPARLVQLTGGSYGYGRALAADSVAAGGGELLAAVEASQYDGPWTRGDDYERVNALVRWSRGDSANGLSLTAMGYDGDWRSTDQIPRRAVEAGDLGRFDLVDPDVGGASSRYSLTAELNRGTADSLWRATAYLLKYDLELFSNFTYVLDHPERGDEFEQLDDRWVGGLNAGRRWLVRLAGRDAELAVGVQVRADRIDNGLFRSRDRRRFATVRRDSITQVTGGPYAEASVRWNDWLRTRAGLRADYYHAEVDSNLPVNSGDEDDVLLSPKLSLIFGPWTDSELYLNLGYGFHSNDARGATIRVDPASGEAVDAVQPLVRARGAEVGVRSGAVDGLVTTLSLFALELDSELVFVGDAGGTEASRPSRRLGVEWTNFWQVSPRWSADLDVAWTDAHFTDDDPAGGAIPGAVETVVAAGITATGYGPWSGALRLRWFSGAPLIEDGSVRSGVTALLNARFAYALPNGLTLAVEGFNLLDRDDSDIEYFYASRLPGEPAEGLEDVHFHPVEKPSARLVASWRF